MLQWRLTDEQLIARLRSSQQTNRYWGLIPLLFGLLLVAGGYYFWNQSSRLFQYDQTKSADVENQTLPAPYAGRSFNLGVLFGTLIAGAMLTGAGVIGTGLRMLIWGTNRETKLLLQCWDRLHSDT